MLRIGIILSALCALHGFGCSEESSGPLDDGETSDEACAEESRVCFSDTHGDQIRICLDGRWTALEDCTGGSCQMHDDGPYCKPELECDDVGIEGVCEGGTALWCDVVADQIVLERCLARGEQCAVLEGFAQCIAPDHDA